MSAQLLGKNTGYFMGKDYYKDQGKKGFVDAANEVGASLGLNARPPPCGILSLVIVEVCVFPH